ncbi:hypothetical protein CNR22_02220 [Sphingobacteriaceae bacterium]|nr:hypothetical protein CNR22_02220 [Sphingobacteriaceae bacterium]
MESAAFGRPHKVSISSYPNSYFKYFFWKKKFLNLTLNVNNIKINFTHMRSTLFFKLTLFLNLLCFSITCSSQKDSSYSMELIRAVQFNSGGQHRILTFLKVTPTVPDFKLILSMKLSYEVGQGMKVIDLQKQQANQIRLTVYGNTMVEKYKPMYELIKEKVDFTKDQNIRIILFDFTDISKSPIDNMTMIYGLWEGKNEDIRNETKFTVNVEPIQL